MIKRFLKIYPSIYFTKHTCIAPEIKESTNILKKDLVFNPVENKKIYLNNKLKNQNSVNEIKRVYYFKLWNALTQYNFTLFENTIQQYLNEGYKYDEVIYTLLVHSYILNHKKKKENAYLVIEEMKRAYMHPTIIKINERMVNSFAELEIIFCEPTKNLWINICRFIWEISIKLNRERKRKLREQLALLHPNEVLKLTKDHLKTLLKKEYEENLLNTMETLNVDSDIPYDHMLIEENNSRLENKEENEEDYEPEETEEMDETETKTGGEVLMLQNDYKNIDNEYKMLGRKNIRINKKQITNLFTNNNNNNNINSYNNNYNNNNNQDIYENKEKGRPILKREQNNISKHFAHLENINVMDEDMTETPKGMDSVDDVRDIEDVAEWEDIELQCNDKETFSRQENSLLNDEEDFDIELLKKYFKYK